MTKNFNLNLAQSNTDCRLRSLITDWVYAEMLTNTAILEELKSTKPVKLQTMCSTASISQSHLMRRRANLSLRLGGLSGTVQFLSHSVGGVNLDGLAPYPDRSPEPSWTTITITACLNLAAICYKLKVVVLVRIPPTCVLLCFVYWIL